MNDIANRRHRLLCTVYLGTSAPAAPPVASLPLCLVLLILVMFLLECATLCREFQFYGAFRERLPLGAPSKHGWSELFTVDHIDHRLKRLLHIDVILGARFDILDLIICGELLGLFSRDGALFCQFASGAEKKEGDISRAVLYSIGNPAPR